MSVTALATHRSFTGFAGKLPFSIEGDFKADLLRSNSDINIKDFMNLTYSLGCILLITHPTRITTTSSTLLVHVYTNNVVGEHESFILVEDVSDHLPVMVCSNLSLPMSEKSTVTLIRDTKNFDIEKFLDKLTREASHAKVTQGATFMRNGTLLKVRLGP